MSSEPEVAEDRVVDTGRKIAAIVLFAIWPVAQVFVPRATPFFLTLAVVVVLIAEIGARRRGLLSCLTPGFPLKEPFAITFFLFLALMALSLFWSPMPWRGAKDVAVLLFAFLATDFLIRHFSRLAARPVAIWVIGALVVGSVGLILESWEITSLHDTFLHTNGIFDLNRNAAWLLVMGCAALGLLARARVSVSAALVVVVLIVFAIFSAQGEAAKLAVLTTAIAALATRFFPVLVKPLFTLMATIVLAMPLLAGALADDTGKPRIPLPLEAHAGHRIALWQGYAKLVVQKPIFGWGAKADRKFGKNGQAAGIATERGYPSQITSPHNAALEVWVCLGAVGAALAAMMLVLAGWRFASMSMPARVSGVAVTVGIFTISMTGSAFYQSWWIATIAIGFMVWGCAVRRNGQGMTR